MHAVVDSLNIEKEDRLAIGRLHDSLVAVTEKVQEDLSIANQMVKSYYAVWYFNLNVICCF